MKKEQLAQREQSLLTAALNCFAEERCEDVTVARIAKLAGVAKGTVYLHFKSKDEICARLAQDFYNTLDEKYCRISGDGRARLAAIVDTSIRHYAEHSQYRHIVQYCYREHFLQNIDADLSKSLQRTSHSRRQHIAKALELGMQDRSLMADATEHLTGICCTLDGALLSLNATADKNISANAGTSTLDTGLINAVTQHIFSSAEDRKPAATAAAPEKQDSPELITEV